ncbi:TetR/AcrR family transcriptional regulator [Nocardioides sp. AN3]
MSRVTTNTTPAQRRILDAAVDAFAEHGFGGTATRDIATRAGRSPAAVYIHYETKEELLFAISLGGHQAALACLRGALESSDDPVCRIAEAIRSFSLWHMENAKLGRIVQYELHALSPAHRAQIDELRRQINGLLVGALRAGVSTGDFEIDDLESAARALLSMCIDFVRWFDPAIAKDRHLTARRYADLARHMLRSRAR